MGNHRTMGDRSLSILFWCVVAVATPAIHTRDGQALG